MGAVQPTTSEYDAGLACLTAIIGAEGGDVAMSEAALYVLSTAADAAQPPAMPDGLVALPCPKPAARWHLDGLLATAAHDATSRAKRLLHARLLGYLLAPDQPQFRPLVTILIPVYNRAALCAEAVESCLAQSWRPLEILVIDDGSTDDLASTLRPYGDAVRLLRKANGGVSSARNMGIAAARGDFIHFLDSDNLLLPDAVALKVAAFVATADAELCYSAALTERDATSPRKLTHVPGSSESCPTRSLVAAIASRLPFFISTAMIARWTARAVDPFEEDLRSAEDLRYWLTLALRGARVVGLVPPLTVRRVQEDSLSSPLSRPEEPRLIAHGRNLRDTLMHREHWQYAGQFCSRFLRQHATAPIASEPSELLKHAFDDLRTAIRRLGTGAHSAGVSPLPVLADLRSQFRAHRREGRLSARHPRHRMLLGLERAILDAIRQAPDLTRRDVDFWLQGSGGPPIRQVMRQILAALGPWNTGVRRRCAAASLLLRRLPHVPTNQDVARFRKVRRWLGATAAYAAVRMLSNNRQATRPKEALP